MSKNNNNVMEAMLFREVMALRVLPQSIVVKRRRSNKKAAIINFLRHCYATQFEPQSENLRRVVLPYPRSTIANHHPLRGSPRFPTLNKQNACFEVGFATERINHPQVMPVWDAPEAVGQPRSQRPDGTQMSHTNFYTSKWE